MTGTIIAQAIPVAISPILTRIYTPEDFGLFALFFAIASILGSLANGSYELAIMLPKKDEDAINIVALGFIITVILSLMILVFVILFNDYLVNLLNNKEIGVWLYFVPIAVFFTGIFNILNYFNNRKKYYKDIANATIIKSIVMAVIQLSVGFFKNGASGLISGQIISQMFANIRLLKNIMKDRLLISSVNKIKIVALAKKYRDFPQFSMWAGLASTSSKHLINILVSLFYSISTLGFYSLVQRVLSMPSSIIGGSIGQVFFQEATREKQQTGSCMISFKTTLKKLIFYSIVFYSILYLVISDLFIIVFGDDWKIAGEYAKILTPLLAVQFIVSPLTKVNQVYLKNKNVMLWQFGLLFLYVVIFLFSKQFHLEFEYLLEIIVVAVSLYYLFHLYLLYSYIKKGN